jgi:hypothetical protein
VSGENAEVAVFTGQLGLSDLLIQQEALGRGDFELECISHDSDSLLRR